MIRAGERPKVAFELFEEFYFKDVFLGGDEVTESHFEIGRAQSGGFRKEVVSRTRGENDEIRGDLVARGCKANFVGACVDMCYARANHRTARRHGAVEEESVEDLAGVDDDGAIHFEASAVA